LTGELRMACKCPVCKKEYSAVTELLEHIVDGGDSSHEKWLESYCTRSNIDYARLILERINGNQNANKQLSSSLNKDFCKK
jgi:hypothetical protein